MKLYFLLLPLLLLGGQSYAAQPSFDCAKATHPVEQMICADDELAAAYEQALQLAKDVRQVKQKQLEWLKKCNTCEDRDCVYLDYKRRLISLRRFPLHATDGEDINQCIEPDIDWRDYQWILISGKGRPACDAMLDYLISRPADEPPPVCPEDRLPPTSDWSRPQGRDVTIAEKQKLLDGLPESQRQRPKGGTRMEWKLRNAKFLKIFHEDLNRDGVPEDWLAYASHEYRDSCSRVTRCVRLEEYFDPEILIGSANSHNYELRLLNGENLQVDWKYRVSKDILMNGELIYFKGTPYWLTYLMWSQQRADYAHNIRSICTPFRAMFFMSKIHIGANEEKITRVTLDYRPESQNVCRFGYFNRKNVKRELSKRGGQQ